MERPRSRSTYLPSRAILVIGVLGAVWLVIAGLLVLQLEAEGHLDGMRSPATAERDVQRETLAVTSAAPEQPVATDRIGDPGSSTAPAPGADPESAAGQSGFLPEETTAGTTAPAAPSDPPVATGSPAGTTLAAPRQPQPEIPPGQRETRQPEAPRTQPESRPAPAATTPPAVAPRRAEAADASPGRRSTRWGGRGTPAAQPPAVANPSLRDPHDEPIKIELIALFEAIHVGLERPGASVDPSLTDYVAALVRRMNSYAHPFVVRLYEDNPDVARRRAVRAHALLVEAGLRPWLLEVFGERGPTGILVERP